MQQSGTIFLCPSVFPPEQKKIEKPAPHHITLLWDCLAQRTCNATVERARSAGRLFFRLKNVEVTLVEFSNTVAGPKEFSISDGHWQALNKELQKPILMVVRSWAPWTRVNTG